MKISRIKNNIVIKVPYWSKRMNPYMEGQDVGEYPTLTGLIIHHRKDGVCDEIGWAYTIDMAYKDKSDQYTEIIIQWDGEEENFIKKCEELKLRYVILEL